MSCHEPREFSERLSGALSIRASVLVLFGGRTILQGHSGKHRSAWNIAELVFLFVGVCDGRKGPCGILNLFDGRPLVDAHVELRRRRSPFGFPGKWSDLDLQRLRSDRPIFTSFPRVLDVSNVAFVAFDKAQRVEINRHFARYVAKVERRPVATLQVSDKSELEAYAVGLPIVFRDGVFGGLFSHEGEGGELFGEFTYEPYDPFVPPISPPKQLEDYMSALETRAFAELRHPMRRPSGILIRFVEPSVLADRNIAEAWRGDLFAPDRTLVVGTSGAYGFHIRFAIEPDLATRVPWRPAHVVIVPSEKNEVLQSQLDAAQHLSECCSECVYVMARRNEKPTLID